MQSRLVLVLLIAAISLVSSSSNDLVQATPEYQDQFSPTCSQSLEVQQTTTQNPDEVSRRTMTGMELVRGSLPVNRGTHGISKLFANALRNFFVHPDSLRRRNKRSTSLLLRVLFPPPPGIKPQDPEPQILPLHTTSRPVRVTIPTTARSMYMPTSTRTSTKTIIKVNKTNFLNEEKRFVPEISHENATKMLENGEESNLTRVSDGYKINCNSFTFLGSLTFLCLIW